VTEMKRSPTARSGFLHIGFSDAMSSATAMAVPPARSPASAERSTEGLVPCFGVVSFFTPCIRRRRESGLDHADTSSKSMDPFLSQPTHTISSG
jgi:hypothetical protein